MIDLHVHDAHFIRLLFGGLPQAVTSRGRLRGATAEYCGTLMHFSDPEIVVTAQCGVIHQTGRPFTHGFEIHCQLATLLFDFSVIDGEPVTSVPLTILHGDGGVERPPIQGDPVQSFVAEITEVAASVRSGQPSPILSGSLASDAIRLCQAQADSLREQRTVSL